MHKKRAILLLFSLFVMLSFAIFVRADITGTAKFGLPDHYVTKDANISIEFIRYDANLERAYFNLEGDEISLLIGQTKNISDIKLTFLGLSGTSVDELSANFLLQGESPISCDQVCENNNIMNFFKFFKKDFDLCKEDCTKGCNLYLKKACIANESWLVDNCGNKAQLMDNCSICNSGVCTSCGNKKCEPGENSVNCIDCRNKPRICLIDSDCDTGSCISGYCTKKTGNNNTSESIKQGKDDYPIIIVHGFASSPKKMKELQRELSFDLGYVNGGEITLAEDCPSLDKKTIYLVSYYSYEKSRTDKISDVLNSAYDKMKSSAKEGTYVDKFSKLMTKVKACTDSDKVDIIAHSMGGLVVRQYIGVESNIKNINKLIILGTPNHGGIYGTQTYKLFKGLETSLGDRKSLLKDCATIGMPSVVLSLMDGRDASEDCQQLQTTDIALKDTDETPGDISYFTIAGDIDGIGDGTVAKESVKLNGSIFDEVVDCDHFDLKNPSRCKAAYNDIKTALGYDPLKKRDIGFFREAIDWVASMIDYSMGWFE